MLWSEITSGKFEEARAKAKGVCVLVVGCMEQHGHHLPIGQDVIQTAGVVEAAAKREPVVIFPHMYFGEKQGAGEFPGTVIFSTRLMQDILSETCSEIARNGFGKILLISGHGGNTNLLQGFARSVLYTPKDYSVFVYNCWQAWPKVHQMLKIIDSGNRKAFPELSDADIEYLRYYAKNNKNSGHGCLFETSLTLATRPDLVDLSRMDEVSGVKTGRLSHLSRAGIYSPYEWMADYPDSLASDAHKGISETIGKCFFNYSVKKTAEVFRLLKEDTETEKYRLEWAAKQKKEQDK